MTTTQLPTLADFEQALTNVRQVAIETPVLHSNFLSNLVGQEVFLKAENLQRTGAYKLRGAFNRMSKLTAAERKRGVVAASAGNHAQGVALAAKKLGIKATIFMPIGASQACIVPSAAQSAWERQRGQNAAQNSFAQHSLAQDSILAQQYNQMYGVLR